MDCAATPREPADDAIEVRDDVRNWQLTGVETARYRLEDGFERSAAADYRWDSCDGPLWVNASIRRYTGRFRAQGRTAVKARAIIDDALALQDAGVLALVAECIPAPLGKALSDALEIPIIGIGAGPRTDGQVLVYHDLLGSLAHPHHQRFVPKFCKVLAQVGDESITAISAHVDEVKNAKFPTMDYSPYGMPEDELRKFQAMLDIDKDKRSQQRQEMQQKIKDQDEYESIHLY